MAREGLGLAVDAGVAVGKLTAAQIPRVTAARVWLGAGDAV